MKKNFHLELTRLLIGIVVFFNLQCALAFLLAPSNYTPGFELSGVPGVLMIRGLGVLFLMWTIPYLFALSDPIRNRVSLIEAVFMQGVGLVGESLMLLTLPEGHLVLRETATRFIIFDGGGLVLLVTGLYLSLYYQRNARELLKNNL